MKPADGQAVETGAYAAHMQPFTIEFVQNRGTGESGNR
jgi:hypothetical protein